MRQRLPCPAAHVDVPLAGGTHRESERQRLSFPGSMEQLTFGLRDHRFPQGLSAEVRVRLIAHRPPSGDLGNPVPIIESRVTNAASCSSVRLCVPAGRRGNTR